MKGRASGECKEKIMMRLIPILAVVMMITQLASANDPSFQNVSYLLEHAPRAAGALAWGDVDNDGDQDLFCGGINGIPSVLYENRLGVFEDVTANYSLTGITNVLSAELTDYNQDGRTDLLCRTSDAHRVRLFRQASSSRFQQVELGQWSADGQAVRSTLWTDADHNGTLDLVLSNGPEVNSSVLVLTQQDESFYEERALELPAEDTGIGGLCMVDFDGDRVQDLFCGYMGGSGRSRLYRDNGNGTYSDWSGRAGLPEKIGSHGATWADFNNDQHLDFFVPGDLEGAGMYYYEPMNGLPYYKDVTGLLGISPECLRTVEAHAVDVNMDGYTDLFVVREDNLGCSLFMNDPSHEWKDCARDLGLDHTRRHTTSCAWGDMDNDGDMDLAISQEEGGVTLYRNTTRFENEYVVLHLRPLNTNTEIPNCQIYFEFENCKQIAATGAWTCSRGGDGSGVTIVSSEARRSESGVCVVTWPSGAVSDIPLLNLNMRKHNTIYEPGGVPNAIGGEEIHGQGELGISIGNSPNPFNPTTSVNFEIVEAGLVTLNVYDLLGREVALLANREFEAGVHRVTFDAGNLPTGLYTAKLTTAGETKLHRMLLMK